MKNWFSITAKGKGNAEIVLFDEIGLYGITAKNFYDQLKALGDVKNILLRINSPGGDVFDGIAIYNMLKNHSARVDVVVDGIAASIASTIAMAGAKITMPSNTFMFIHDPLALVVGDADVMREMADSLDKIASSLIGTYIAKTGKSEEEIKKWMAEDTWFTAAEALEVGLCDEVLEAVEIAAFFDLKKFANPPAALLQPAPAPEQIRAHALRAEAEKQRAAAIVEVLRAADHPDVAGDLIEGRITANEVLARIGANSIIKAQDTDKLRRRSMTEAGAIVQACAEAGHAELAAGFLNHGLDLEIVKAELAKPENLATGTAGYAAADEVKKIFALCSQAGVADMAQEFVAKGRTVAWVEDRLKHAGAIKGRCAAARMFNRAAGYITANLTPEEVTDSLMALKLAMDGPELDNHMGPEGYFGDSTPGKPAKPKLMTIAEVYAIRNRYNGKKKPVDELIEALAAKLKESGALR